MRDIAIGLTHRPGELARVAAVLAHHNVNLKSGTALAIGNSVLLRFLPDDIVAAREALESANIRFAESEVVPVLLESRAGELAMVSTRLAEGGVNLRAIYMMGATDRLIELAIVPDNLAVAKRLLK